VGFYSRVIFPRVCDFLLDRPSVAKHRQELLSGVTGEVLEIGFGTGLNLPHYPNTSARSQPSILILRCTARLGRESRGRESTWNSDS
jgi:hypothetical protein